jgi:leucyl aminopeptidase
MKFTLAPSLRGLKSDVLVLGWFEKQQLSSHPSWAQLNATTQKAIQRQLKKPGVTLDWGSMHVIQIQTGPWANIVITGLGKKDEWSARRNRLGLRRLARMALHYRWSTMTMSFLKLTADDVRQDVENLLLATYEYRAHKQTPKHGWPELKQFTFVSASIGTEYAAAIRQGETVAHFVNHARDLANTPGGLMTPKSLAAAAIKLGTDKKLNVKVLTSTQMKKLKMGALLGVGMGSEEEPRLMVMEYHGAAKGQAPLVFVGKGITFDSGGYNLKPGNSMSEMHMDMSGGASVMCAIAAIAELRLPVNVVAIIPAAENMVSGSGFRPGDILKSMSGLNIEIGNTDAEGRLVLADGLTYAQKFYRPKLLVDVATLTGAALVALGQEATALLTKQPTLQAIGQDIGEASGDYVWPLPMWEEYDGLVKATFGDVTNSGKSRWGGTIEGAIFLSKFVKNTPWIHLDIAPTMSSIDGQHLAPGATGTGVRWLVTLAERMASGTLAV